MKKETKPKMKTGPKKEKAPKMKPNVSLIKNLQKEYDQLVKLKKETDKKIKIHETFCKEMGYKLKRRVEKIETKPETGEKTGKKRGRKKKQEVMVEGKSEETKEGTTP